MALVMFQQPVICANTKTCGVWNQRGTNKRNKRKQKPIFSSGVRVLLILKKAELTRRPSKKRVRPVSLVMHWMLNRP